MLNWIETFFDAVEIAGTLAFAASGAMAAIDRELDMFGVLFLGITSAVGGGMIRDVLLGIAPPDAFRHPVYVLVAALVSLIVFLVAWLRQRFYRQRLSMIERGIGVFDAVGLGIFGVVGVEAAIASGHGDNGFLCLFMGMTTGVGGGILRDILSQTVPMVLKKRIYALAVIFGSAAFYYLRKTAPMPMAVMSGMLVTIAIRACASHFKWNLPIARLK